MNNTTWNRTKSRPGSVGLGAGPFHRLNAGFTPSLDESGGKPNRGGYPIFRAEDGGGNSHRPGFFCSGASKLPAKWSDQGDGLDGILAKDDMYEGRATRRGGLCRTGPASSAKVIQVRLVAGEVGVLSHPDSAGVGHQVSEGRSGRAIWRFEWLHTVGVQEVSNARALAGSCSAPDGRTRPSSSSTSTVL